MTAEVLTLFNNKGGVGKTSLVYHFSWMMSQLGKCVLAVDLDPQSNLTAAFLEENVLFDLWESEDTTTIYRAVKPFEDVGDLKYPVVQKINDDLHLIPGEVALSTFEDKLADAWSKSLDTQPNRYFRILSSFWEIMQKAARDVSADLIIVDIGPNLGAINRTILLSSDFIIVPLAADMFSIQGLRNLGPTLRDWNTEWNNRVNNWRDKKYTVPDGNMKHIGYLCQQHGERMNRPVRAYERWLKKIPGAYAEYVLETNTDVSDINQDPNCLGTIKHYRSLIPLAQEHKRPLFMLTPADGAIGSHSNAVKNAYSDFEEITRRIFSRINL